MTLKSHCDAAIRSRLAVALLLIGALFAMGAKWVERPIDDVQHVVGKWRGSGESAGGTRFAVTFIIKEDGSFHADAVSSRVTVRGGRRLRLNDGKLWLKSIHNDQNVIITLYESNKGKKMLKARREDGLTWRATRVKKKK